MDYRASHDELAKFGPEAKCEHCNGLLAQHAWADIDQGGVIIACSAKN